MTKVLEAVHEVGVQVGGCGEQSGHGSYRITLTRAGRELNGSFSEYLTIGCNSYSLSILAYARAGETEDPAFELIDHERNLTYGVQQIPSPPTGRTAAPRARPATRGVGRRSVSSRKTLSRAPESKATYLLVTGLVEKQCITLWYYLHASARVQGILPHSK